MNEQAILDETAEVIEKTLDTIEDIKIVTKNNPWLIAGVGVVSFVAGAAISYWATKKTAMALFEETLEEEIMKAQHYFDRLHKEGDFSTPAAAVDALIPADEQVTLETAESLREAYEGRPEDKAMKIDYTQPYQSKKAKKKARRASEVSEEHENEAHEEVAAVTRNIWVNDRPIEDGGWDFDSVVRSEDEPFVISEDEFFESGASNGNYEADQLTFYALDEVLADATDDVVPSDRVGEENLKKFGKLPGDPNVIYVKNEMLKRVYEIAYSEGSYKHETQGLDYTQAEAERMARKIRGDDD